MSMKFVDKPPEAVRYQNNLIREEQKKKYGKPKDEWCLREPKKAAKFRKWKAKRLGTFGPASEVRRIDPATGLVLDPKK